MKACSKETDVRIVFGGFFQAGYESEVNKHLTAVNIKTALCVLLNQVARMPKPMHKHNAVAPKVCFEDVLDPSWAHLLKLHEDLAGLWVASCLSQA